MVSKNGILLTSLPLEFVYDNTGRMSAPLMMSNATPSELLALGAGTRSRGPGSRSIQPLPPAATAALSAPPSLQYDILPDGRVVKMVCPVCGAEMFRSMLGFLNHCRMNCRISFANHDERLERCGVVVPEEEVPEQFRRLSGNARRELELVQLRAEVQPTRIVTAVAPEIVEHSSLQIDYESFGVDGKKGASTWQDITPSQNTNNNTPSQDNNPPLQTQPRKLPDTVSRYYWKRRVVIGNAAKCIMNSSEREEDVMVGGTRPGTHKFKLYLRDYFDGEGVLKDIKFVRYFLHPAYKPDDVVDVQEAPFLLERAAWGEFPIRIQIHFYDQARNKPVDLYHQLSIFGATQNRYIECAQQVHDVLLDRRTDFGLSSRLGDLMGEMGSGLGMKDDLNGYREQEESEEVGEDDSEEEQLQPLSSQSTVQVSDPLRLLYCRYCGLPHHPQTGFSVLQKHCAQKPRRIRVSSKSGSQALFNSVGQVLESHVGNVTYTEEDEAGLDPDEARNEDKLVAALMLQLNLSCFKQQPNALVTRMMVAAMKAFLKQLLLKSSLQIPANQTRATLDQNLPAVITPIHLYNTITSHPEEFDFLSNAYMAPPTAE